MAPDEDSESGAQRKLSMKTWEQRLTREVARAVRHWRQERGMTAKDLELATERLGKRVPKSVIVNLENERRESIALAEILVLAAALDIAPVLLIAPLGQVESVEILPDLDISPWEARGWVHGAFVPPYSDLSYENWRAAQRILGLYDVHRALVKRYLDAEQRVKLMSRNLSQLVSADDLEKAGAMLRRRAALLAQELAAALSELQAHRQRMVQQLYIPPALPRVIEDALIASSANAMVEEDDEPVQGESSLDTLFEMILQGVLEHRRDSDFQRGEAAKDDPNDADS